MKMVRELLKLYGSYSKELNIVLKNGKPKEIFKWFLASLLFAKPIRDTVAMKTYKIFESAGVTSSKRILNVGWHGLVDLLDKGGYTRYDFSTADKLLEMAKNLEEKYGGNLVRLYKTCRNEDELREKLKDLAKGIGEITIDIFFRELRGIWKVNPKYSEFSLIAAKNLGIKDPKKFWDRHRVKGRDFIDFETALLRLGKDYCRKNRCQACKMKIFCRKNVR